MLQNISVRFDPVEDRLVLRLVLKAEGQAPQEHWLHLTRRLWTGWRQDLQAMVDLSAQAPERLDPAAKASISKGHHEAMTRQASVRTGPAATPALTLQAGPVLVTKIVCGRRRTDGRWLISFERRRLPALGLVLSGQTLHGLVDALTRRVQAADWGLAPMPVESTADDVPAHGLQWH